MFYENNIQIVLPSSFGMSARRKARREARRQQGALPGMSPKHMKKAMGGMDVKNIDGVKEVVIKTETEEIILIQPEVQLLNIGGQSIYTITAEGEKRRSPTKAEEKTSTETPSVTVSETDIEFIADKAGVSKEKAKEALIKSNGDLAEALLSLQ